MLIAASWRHVGYMMILYLAGLKGVDPALKEAAAIDGATGWQAFRYVVFPALRPVNIVVLVITVIESLRAFDLVFVINGGRNGLELLSVLVTQNIIGEASRIGYGSAIAVDHAGHLDRLHRDLHGQRVPGGAAMTSVQTTRPAGAGPAPVRRRRRPLTPARVALHAFLAVISLVFLFPLLYAVYTSLRPYAETAAVRLLLAAARPHLRQLHPRLAAVRRVLHFLINTLIIVVPCAAAHPVAVVVRGVRAGPVQGARPQVRC